MTKFAHIPVPKLIQDAAKDFASPIMDARRLVSIYQILYEATTVPGQIVDLGSAPGTTALFIQQCLNELGSNRRLHCYDAFPIESLITKSCEPAKEVGCDPENGVLLLQEAFERHDVLGPVIHPGWFANTLPDQLPQRIAFAHIDCDLYESILEALIGVYGRMSEGAICVVDDYGLGFLPCVKKATDEFLADKPEKIFFTVGGIQAAFVKQEETPQFIDQLLS